MVVELEYKHVIVKKYDNTTIPGIVLKGKYYYYLLTNDSIDLNGSTPPNIDIVKTFNYKCSWAMDYYDFNSKTPCSFEKGEIMNIFNNQNWWWND